MLNMFKTLKIFPVLVLMMSLYCIGQSSYWSPNLPNGATAAAATTIAYISATSANTVTFTHVVTTASGGTENISCTPY